MTTIISAPSPHRADVVHQTPCTYKRKAVDRYSALPLCYNRFSLYLERELNPHGHCWPQDFKSGVSTNSTIQANGTLRR